MRATGTVREIPRISFVRWIPVFRLTRLARASGGGLLLAAATLAPVSPLDIPGVPQGGMAVWLGFAARYASLIVVFYGIPTGLVLAWFAGDFGRMRRSDG